jgi:effector-binding domain-containing protein
MPKPPAKIADMPGVRAYDNEPNVELWRHSNGRLVIRAYNEGGYNGTEVDLLDLLDWAQSSGREVIAEIRSAGQIHLPIDRIK